MSALPSLSTALPPFSAALQSHMPFWQQWMTDTLFATSILMLGVLLLRRPVARFFGPQIAYLLWLLPAARLFMPAFTKTVEIDAASLPLVQPLINADMAATDGAAQGANMSLASPIMEAMTGPGAIAILLTLWLGGAALFLIVQLASYLQHRAEILTDGRIIEQFQDIDVIEVAGIDSPFAFGIFRRFIAVPLDFSTYYSSVEQQLALRHELAHHEARDLWANFAALFLLSLHWFNPLAWMAYRAFRFDQEAACDARVLASSDDRERHSYGLLIAKAATGRTLAFASPLTPKEKLCERLTLMSQTQKSPLRRRLGALAIAGTAAMAMTLTATISYAYEVKAPDAPVIALAPAKIAAPAKPVLIAITSTAPAAPIAGQAEKTKAKKAKKAKDKAEKFKAKNKPNNKPTITRTSSNDIAFNVARVEIRDVSARGLSAPIVSARGMASSVFIRAAQDDVEVPSEAQARKLAEDALASIDTDALIPDISFVRDCSKGEGTADTSTTVVDGRTVMVVTLCEAEAIAEARAGALEGLQEARSEIMSDDDIPADFRKRLLETLERQIKELEQQRLSNNVRLGTRDI